MSVEASIYSSAQPLTEPELLSAVKKRGTLVRLLDDEGEPLASPPAGPLHGRFVVIGWPKADAETTHAADTAIAARDKPALDLLAQSNKLGWCELGVRPFEYGAYWAKFPTNWTNTRSRSSRTR